MKIMNLLTRAFVGIVSFLVGSQLTLAAPILRVAQFTQLPTAGSGFTCAIGGSIKQTAGNKNEVTYWISYTSSYATLGAPYSVSATTALRSHTVTHFSTSGKADIVVGKHYVSQLGGNSRVFSFSTQGISSLTVNARVNNVPCTPKNFNAIYLFPNIAVDGLIKPGLPELVINPPPYNIPQRSTSCTIYSEGFRKNDGSVVVGAAISYKALVKGEHVYEVTGQLMRTGAPVQTHKGTYTSRVDGDGVIFNADGRGFLFDIPADYGNSQFILNAKIGEVKCPMVTFTLPQGVAPVSAPSANGDSNSSASNDASQQNVTPSDGADSDASVSSRSDSVSGGNQTLNDDANTSTVSQYATSDATVDKNDQIPLSNSSVIPIQESIDNQNNWKDYLIYGMLGVIIAAGIGYAVYVLTKRQATFS